MGKEPVKNHLDDYEKQLDDLKNDRNMIRNQKKFLHAFLDNLYDFWTNVENKNRDNEPTDIFKEEFYQIRKMLNENFEKVKSNMLMNPKNANFRKLMSFYKEFGNLIRRSDDETRHEILAKMKKHSTWIEPLYDVVLRKYLDENFTEISKKLKRYWEKIDDKNEMQNLDKDYKNAMEKEDRERKKRMEREREQRKREDDLRKQREQEERQRRFIEEKERQVKERIELERQRKLEDDRIRWENEERERARREESERQQREEML